MFGKLFITLLNGEKPSHALTLVPISHKKSHYSVFSRLFFTQKITILFFSNKKVTLLFSSGGWRPSSEPRRHLWGGWWCQCNMFHINLVSILTIHHHTEINQIFQVILYVGLGMISVGLVITFVGLGEKGFKTLELKLIGPSLVGCGVFFALLRVLFCTLPSCCRSHFLHKHPFA